MRRLNGFLDARRVGDWILSSTAIRREYVDEAREAQAWRWYLKYHDQDFSFTDVTSMTVMRAYGLNEVFTFDSDFAKAGFTTLPRRGRAR